MTLDFAEISEGFLHRNPGSSLWPGHAGFVFFTSTALGTAFLGTAFLEANLTLPAGTLALTFASATFFGPNTAYEILLHSLL